MAAEEYLAFLPLLIYGIAITALFGEWKRLFSPKSIYIPYILFTLILTETAMYNVYVYFKLLDQLDSQNYTQYLISILPPFLFMLLVNVFTPETGENTKEYFIKNKPTIFVLFAMFMASHYLYNFDESQMTLIGRGIGVMALIILGFVPKQWTLYIPILFWLYLVFHRATTSIG